MLRIIPRRPLSSRGLVLSEDSRPLKPVQELDALKAKRKHARNLKRMGDR